MLWSPSGFPFGVRRGMIGCGIMPLDTFTYYLLKVGFIPPLRAHWASARSGSYRNRSRRSPAHFCFWRSLGPWGGCSWSGSPFSSESHCSEIQDQRKVQYPHGFPMKRFVKCFFELLTQIIVKVRKCKVQSAKGLRFALSACGFGWLLLLDEVVPLTADTPCA